MDEDVGIIINIKVPNVKALNDLIRMFGRLTRGMNDVNKSANKAGQSTRKVFAEMARSFATVSIAMNDLRFQMSALASGLSKLTFGAAASGIRIAADTEEANARLGFALTRIGEKYDDIVKKIDRVSLRTVITRKDIVNMVSDFAIQKINAFDEGLNALTFTTKDGTKQAITAMEVLNDAVAFSGKNTQRVMFSVREAVAERKIRPGKQLSEDLQLAGKDLDKFNSALKNAKSGQEAFNTLLQLMAERVGGITESINKTVNFILKQFADFRDKLATEIFGPSLGEIAAFLREVGEEVIKLVEGDQLKVIGKAIQQVVGGFTGLARIMFILIQGSVTFIEKFPQVIGLFAAATTAVVVFAGALTGIIAFTAPLLAFASLFTLIAAAFSFISGIGLVIAGGFVVAAAAVAGLVAALTGAGVLVLANTLKAKGFMDIWERFKIVVSAVSEGIRNMSGRFAVLSLETARTLDDRGLLGLVKSVLMWWTRFRRSFETFQIVMRAFGNQFAEAFKPAIQASKQLAESLGIDLDKGVTGSMSEAEQAGVRMGNTVAGVLLNLIDLMAKLIDLTEGFVALFSLDVASARAGRQSEGIQKRVQEGEIPVPTNILASIFEPGTFLGNLGLTFKRPGEVTAAEAEESQLVRESLRTAAREERNRQGRISPSTRRNQLFAEGLLGGGDRSGIPAPLASTGLVDVQSILGQLSEVREQSAGAALLRFMQAGELPTQKSRQSEQDAAQRRLAKLMGSEAAAGVVKALQSGRLTIVADNKAVTSITEAIEGDVEFQLGASN